MYGRNREFYGGYGRSNDFQNQSDPYPRNQRFQEDSNVVFGPNPNQFFTRRGDPEEFSGQIFERREDKSQFGNREDFNPNPEYRTNLSFRGKQDSFRGNSFNSRGASGSFREEINPPRSFREENRRDDFNFRREMNEDSFTRGIQSSFREEINPPKLFREENRRADFSSRREINSSFSRGGMNPIPFTSRGGINFRESTSNESPNSEFRSLKREREPDNENPQVSPKVAHFSNAPQTTNQSQNSNTTEPDLSSPNILDGQHISDVDVIFTSKSPLVRQFANKVAKDIKTRRASLLVDLYYSDVAELRQKLEAAATKNTAFALILSEEKTKTNTVEVVSIKDEAKESLDFDLVKAVNFLNDNFKKIGHMLKMRNRRLRKDIRNKDISDLFTKMKSDEKLEQPESFNFKDLIRPPGPPRFKQGKKNPKTEMPPEKFQKKKENKAKRDALRVFIAKVDQKKISYPEGDTIRDFVQKTLLESPDPSKYRISHFFLSRDLASCHFNCSDAETADWILNLSFPDSQGSPLKAYKRVSKRAKLKGFVDNCPDTVLELVNILKSSNEGYNFNEWHFIEFKIDKSIGFLNILVNQEDARLLETRASSLNFRDKKIQFEINWDASKPDVIHKIPINRIL